MSSERRELPKCFHRATVLESIPPFATGKVRIHDNEAPEYPHYPYEPNLEWSKAIEQGVVAHRVVADWVDHLNNYLYYVQSQEDAGNHRVRSLNAHTELMTLICERIKLDPTPLWAAFDKAHFYAEVFKRFRDDDDRDSKFDNYAAQAAGMGRGVFEQISLATRLIGRVHRQLDLSSDRSHETPQSNASVRRSDSGHVEVALQIFISYSHKDEDLRTKLDSHLASLVHAGFIAPWHDRKLGAGTEWRAEIDKHIESADIIVLLVSPDFIASDYCRTVEMQTALRRHREGTALVIPVILRPCHWQDLPIKEIQALPKDAKPITAWSNRDEAWTDVALGIRSAVVDLRNRQQAK